MRATNDATPHPMHLKRAYDEPSGHDGARVLEERDEAREAVDRLLDRARSGPLTLVLASKDVKRSSAALLREHLEARLAE